MPALQKRVCTWDHRLKPVPLKSVVGDADFGEDGGIGGGSGAFLRGDPGAHAIGGGVHGGERRAAEGVVNESGGKGVAGADGVGDFYREAWVFVHRSWCDEQAAIWAASDAHDL